MVLASAINSKVGLISGILIGALIVVTTSHICKVKRCSLRPVKQPESETKD